MMRLKPAAHAAFAPQSGRNHAAGAIFRPLRSLAALLAMALLLPLAVSAQVGSG